MAFKGGRDFSLTSIRDFLSTASIFCTSNLITVTVSGSFSEAIIVMDVFAANAVPIRFSEEQMAEKTPATFLRGVFSTFV